MTTAFATPAWVSQLTPVLRESLPRPFVLVDDVAERHGSWQWTATTEAGASARWVIVSATSLPDASPEPGDDAAVALAAWQLTPDASQIIESSVARLIVIGTDGWVVHELSVSMIASLTAAITISLVSSLIFHGGRWDVGRIIVAAAGFLSLLALLASSLWAWRGERRQQATESSAQGGGGIEDEGDDAQPSPMQ